MSKDYNQYLDSQEDNEEYDASESWKKDLEDEESKVPPKSFPARVAIDAEQISAYVETYSLEALYNNKENPQFDSIDLILKDGLQITIIGTMEEFEKQFKAALK